MAFAIFLRRAVSSFPKEAPTTHRKPRRCVGSGTARTSLRVDGNVIREQHLAGKPAPDTFLIAAKRFGVAPARAVVIDDAISGVEAGVNGNFGLVIGVARQGNAEELRRHGAHLVVSDLRELVE